MRDFEDNVYLNNFGLTLKEIRQSRGLTQEQLAKAIDVTPSAITMYESGARNPSVKVLIKLSHFFNVSIDKLINVLPIDNDINESVFGISLKDFNNLSSSDKQSIKNFINFIKNNQE